MPSHVKDVNKISRYFVIFCFVLIYKMNKITVPTSLIFAETREN